MVPLVTMQQTLLGAALCHYVYVQFTDGSSWVYPCHCSSLLLLLGPEFQAACSVWRRRCSRWRMVAACLSLKTPLYSLSCCGSAPIACRVFNNIARASTAWDVSASWRWEAARSAILHACTQSTLRCRRRLLRYSLHECTCPIFVICEALSFTDNASYVPITSLSCIFFLVPWHMHGSSNMKEIWKAHCRCHIIAMEVLFFTPDLL